MADVPLFVHASDVEIERWTHPVRGHVGFRTLFGDDPARTSALTVGITEMQPGDWLGLHRHAPPEVYVVVEGEGVLSLDGEERDVAAGTAVFIPGDAEHGVRNTGHGVLRFVYAFPVSDFSEVEYRFSGEGG